MRVRSHGLSGELEGMQLTGPDAGIVVDQEAHANPAPASDRPEEHAGVLRLTAFIADPRRRKALGLPDSRRVRVLGHVERLGIGDEAVDVGEVRQHRPAGGCAPRLQHGQDRCLGVHRDELHLVGECALDQHAVPEKAAEVLEAGLAAVEAAGKVAALGRRQQEVRRARRQLEGGARDGVDPPAVRPLSRAVVPDQRGGRSRLDPLGSIGHWAFSTTPKCITRARRVSATAGGPEPPGETRPRSPQFDARDGPRFEPSGRGWPRDEGWVNREGPSATSRGLG